MKIYCFFFLGLFLFNQRSFAVLLDPSIAVDLLGSYTSSEENKDQSRLDVRSAEVSVFGAIDPKFDGTLSAAAHRESGVSLFEVHEAHMSSTKLIPRSRFKVGHFFLGIGRLNQFHQHDWPFVSAPKIHEELFGDEGVNDTGIEYTYLTPFSQFLEVTLGVTNGYVFGHSHVEGERPKVPTHYIHPVTFFELSETSGMQLGVTYMGRVDTSHTRDTYFGLDLVYKKKEGKFQKYLLQMEAWWRKSSPKNVYHSEHLGGYVFPQYGFNESWFLGARIDLFTNLTQKFLVGEKQKNLDYAIVPTLTYKSSEFALFRLAYSYLTETDQGESDRREHKVELQTTFILGEHPAHDF